MQTIPVLDVRSPGEFEYGHLPGSINMPILEDHQREEIGILYKKHGKEAAFDRGLELIGPKMAHFVRRARRKLPGKKVLIHCWRGGMRSASMSWLLTMAGFDCQLLEGGYKAFRNYGKEQMSLAQHCYIIGGYTGSAKTHVLYELKNLGEQILDIEMEAHHRGSSFGAIGQEEQVNNEQFENNLICLWLDFDLSKTIWVEDESRILGSNHLPAELYETIRKSKVFKLNIPLKTRAQNLKVDYAHLQRSELEQAIRRIEKKLGGQHMQKAIDALNNDDPLTVAEISLVYYDKTYEYGLSKRDQDSIIEIDQTLSQPEEIAKHLIHIANQMQSS